MLRYLLVLLAVLAAVLAVLFDRLWLYVGAGVLLVSSLGLLVEQFWKSYRKDEEEERPTPDATETDESLEDLGIVDIRPEEGREGTPSPRDREGGEEERETRTAPSETGSSGTNPATTPPSSATQSTSNATSEAAGVDSSDRSVVTGEAPVLGPYLESLREALGAQTVCLLIQDEVALTYRIEALASVHPHVQDSGTFNTQTPLLTASMSRQSVGVRRLTEDEVAVEDLGYYTSPPKVDHLAVAPVPRPDEPTTTFLLADATAQADLGRSRARTLLERFAELADLLLETDASGPDPAAHTPTDGHAEPGADATSDRDADASEDEASPRPRREIIAEEMEAAEAASDDLSLVLVHLNRAESIARRGEEAVTSAERLFRARLEQFTPDHRVERFGELTYGIFFRGGADAVEPWAADLETTMAQEEGELEGGVSVGVAVWDAAREDPEALRADATEALREAYKTGACTIVT